MAEVTDPTILKQIQDSPPLTKEMRRLIDPTWVEAVGGIDYGKVAENAPESALNLAKAAAQPFVDPIGTAKGIGEFAAGAFEKMMTSQMESINRIAGEKVDIETPQWDKVTAHYRERYGSPAGFKDAVETDPIGVLADGLSLVWGGKGLSKSAFRALPENVPIGMYEEVAKLTNTKEFRDPAKRREVIKSWLENGIPFTEKGVKKMANIIESINDEITTIINNAPDRRIPREFVLARLPELRATLEGKFGATEDLAMLDRAIDSYQKTIARQESPTMDLKELNEFKKDAWNKVTDWAPAKPNTQKLEDKIYQNVGGTAAYVAGELEPQIKPLNERQAPLLAGREQHMNAVNRINKHNKLLNLSALIGTGSGELIGSMFGFPGIGTAAGATAYMLGKPGAKAPLARAIYNARLQHGFDKQQTDLTKAMAAAYLSNTSESAP